MREVILVNLNNSVKFISFEKPGNYKLFVVRNELNNELITIYGIDSNKCLNDLFYYWCTEKLVYLSAELKPINPKYIISNDYLRYKSNKTYTYIKELSEKELQKFKINYPEYFI